MKIKLLILTCFLAGSLSAASDQCSEPVQVKPKPAFSKLKVAAWTVGGLAFVGLSAYLALLKDSGPLLGPWAGMIQVPLPTAPGPTEKSRNIVKLTFETCKGAYEKPYCRVNAEISQANGSINVRNSEATQFDFNGTTYTVESFTINGMHDEIDLALNGSDGKKYKAKAKHEILNTQYRIYAEDIHSVP